MRVHFLVYSLTSGQLLRRLRAHCSSNLTRVATPAPRTLALHAEPLLPKSQTAPGFTGEITSADAASSRPPLATKSPTTLPPIGHQPHELLATSRAPISTRERSDARATTLMMPVPPIEREPPIEQLAISESGRVLVVSYNTCFLNCFDLQLVEHAFTLLSSCTLSLAVSSLTPTGAFTC